MSARTDDVDVICFALTVESIKPKNIKEAMADSAWIEAMQEELHQFYQSPCGIFINQAKYAQEILKKHGMTSCDSVDHAGCLDSRKSTSGGIQFLRGDKLVSCHQERGRTFMSFSKSLTEYQLADLFTKALPEDSLSILVLRRLGIDVGCFAHSAKVDSITIILYTTPLKSIFRFKIVDTKLPHHQRASKSNKEKSIGED
ncbi:hypothetical protein Tco_1226569 [Tanacetum coccineum]